ncbi:hypothetical protein NXS15_02860 [Mycoplasma sp. CSL7475-4]|uniref:hypothetical protein n=1 Tax=Mycoplasma sp. CSL7475-4 TaxID=2973942 RepID=UPI00216B676F|nr:hypothetical protein [Mycoplasma sp. CSL7475-4]MCS4537052.1 hypothetical protein [Mycoplasma sp. CSL7475-4]
MKIKKIVNWSILTSFAPLMTLSVACDKRDANKSFTEYKSAFDKAQQLYNAVRDIEYVLPNDLAKFSIINKYLNIDLWNYKSAYINKDFKDNELKILGQKVNKNIEIINNIIANNDNNDFENIKTRVLEKSDILQRQIETYRVERFPIFFASEHLYKHHSQSLEDAISANSSSILKIIESKFDNLLKFINDDNVKSKLENIYTSQQKYSILTEKFNILSTELDTKMNQSYKYLDYDFINNWKQLKTDATKFNEQKYYPNQKYKIIDFNFIFAYYLNYGFNKNTDITAKNVEVDLANVERSLKTTYAFNNHYYQKVLASYNTFTSFLWKIGPKGPEFLKKYSFLGRLEDYTKNINKSNKIFELWNNKLNQQEQITYLDDFRFDLPYYLRLYDNQIIWTNAYQSLYNSRANQENFKDN